MNIENRDPLSENADIRGDDWLGNDPITPDNDDWVKPEVEVDIINKKEEEKNNEAILFNGEDAEVTVKRSNGDIEGGWEVVSYNQAKKSYLVISPEKATKNIGESALTKLQEFKNGETVPVIRSSGKLDSGWSIVDRLRPGFLLIKKNIEGRDVLKQVMKHDLINAKITELQQRNEAMLAMGDVVPQDRADIEKNDEKIKYWQDKQRTISKINDDRTRSNAEAFQRSLDDSKENDRPSSAA